jgi:hypothetical protein
MTTPELDPTLAIPVVLDKKAAVLPAIRLPLASFATAFACEVCPTAMLAEAKKTATVAVVGGGVTLPPDVTASDPLPDTPSMVARIDAVPAFVPVTTPDPDTLATPVVVETHDADLPDSTLP